MDWTPLRVGFVALWRPDLALVLALVGAAGLAAMRGRQPGREAGHEPGQQPGHEPGQQPGYEPGREAGHEPGRQPRHEPGREAGHEPGRQTGYGTGQQPGYETGRETARRSDGHAGRMACFLLGLAATYAAVAGPVHALARAGLLSAELTEAGLLIYVAVPLLLCGTPVAWLNRMLVRPAVRRALRVLTRPVGAALVMNVLLFVYAAGLTARPDLMPLSPWTADLADLALSIAAAASWWPVLGATTDVPALGDLAQVVYLLLNWLAVTGLSAYVLLGGAPGGASAAAASGTGLPWGLTPLVDRQVGGVVFSVLSHATYAVATALALLRWVRRENLTASVPQMYQRLRAAGFDHDEARRVANLDVDLELELEPGSEP